MIAETYTVDENGVTIGSGNRQTSPASTVFTLEVNPMPLVKKIAGFHEGVDPFLTIPDMEVALGSTVSVTPNLSSGAAYNEAEYGTLRFEYKENNTVGAYQEGLPPTDKNAEYLVRAVLEGANNYSGIGTSFILRVGTQGTDPSNTGDSPVTTPPTTTSPDAGNITPLLLGAGIGAALLAVAAIVLVKLKKKKSD